MEEKEEKVKKPRAPRKAKAAKAQEAPQTEETATATAVDTQAETRQGQLTLIERWEKDFNGVTVYPAPEKKERKKIDRKPPKKAVKKAEAAAETVPETAQETPKKTAKKRGRIATKAKKETQSVEAEAAEVPQKTAPETVTETVPETAQETAEEKKPAKKQPAKKKAVKKQTAAESTAPAQEEPTQTQTVTKAEKKDAIKAIVRELLKTPCKWAELLENAAKAYKEKYPSKENERDSDVKGRIGSVIDLMKKEGEVVVENGVARLTADEPAMEEKPQKDAPVSVTNEQSAPVVTAETTEQTATEAVEGTQSEENTAVAVVEAATPAPVYDMSALFDRKKPTKPQPKKEVKTQVATIAAERVEEQTQTAAQEAGEGLPAAEKPVAVTEATAQAPCKTERKTPIQNTRRTDVPKRVARGRLPVEESRDPLKEAFLRKLRSLGGDYFEYYSVYLLERYSRKNGRRLEGLRISGGEHDGGIDGEIELTDRLGFRETIYIQAKNWAPTDEKWMVGETLLQQFIGAVAYRQAKEGKQHCRGMFITTSRFTTGAKEMLEQMADKFVGYDGDDLYETAKECQFGLIKGTNGEWKIDEELLSSERALFYML